MRRLGVIFALLLCVTAASATPTFVQCVSNSNPGVNAAVTVSITASSGHLIIVFTSERTDSSSTVTISDSATQSYTQTTSGYVAQNTRAGMFYKANSAALTSVTSTWSGAKQDPVLTVCDFSAMAASSPQDTSVNSNTAGFATSLTSGTFTTTNANDVLLYCVSGDNLTGQTFVVGAGYTIPAGGVFPAAGNSEQACQYKIVSTTQISQTTSMTFNNTRAQSVFAAFKGASTAFLPRRQSTVF